MDVVLVNPGAQEHAHPPSVLLQIAPYDREGLDDWHRKIPPGFISAHSFISVECSEGFLCCHSFTVKYM